MKHFYLLVLTVFTVHISQAQIVTIPDANFKNALLNHTFPVIDTNADGEIQVSEAEAVESIQVDGQNISSLEGIQAFTNMVELSASNNQLTSLDISALTELQGLGLNNNLFTTIDNITFPISSSYGLGLFISNNQLTSISSLPTNITDLFCDNNQLTTINLSGLSNLYEFYGNDNPLTTLILPETGILDYFGCNNTNLTEIDFSNSTLPLSSIALNNNQYLTSVNLNGVTQPNKFSCQNNPVLEAISFKNGYSDRSDPIGDGFTLICNNPSLSFVCADDNEIDDDSYTVNEGGDIVTVTVPGIQQIVNGCGYTDIFVSSYCTFEPGGVFYTIQGTAALDSNTNGCDASDVPAQNLKLNITEGSQTGYFYTNDLGNYSFPVGEGTHTITPDLENPAYFTVSPTSYMVNFPTDTSPYSQDFCITNDLEITILPLELARPGFDANYKIVYKNKGTTTLSGSIDLEFQDDLIDLVSANPMVDSQSTNILSWNYTNLEPFETGEILFTMNLNLHL